MSIQASYFDVISAKNPGIWFRFNETAGTPINSGSIACSLTAGGTPLLNENSDVDGRSVYFNRGSNYSLSNFPSFSLFDDYTFTIEFWIKVNFDDTNISSAQRVLEIANNANTRWIRGDIQGTSAGSARGSLQITTSHATTVRTSISFGSSTALSIADGLWHHIVITNNGGTTTLYLDGGINSQSTATNLPSGFSVDNNGVKRIGSTSTTTGFRGWIDEFALYTNRLTASEINENFVAGSAVYVDDIPGTATAEFIEPTWVNDTNPTADVMTASSASGDHYASNYDVRPPLEKYMESLTLEQYVKFTEYHSIYNYALNQSTNQGSVAFYGNSENFTRGGLQLSGAVETRGSGTDGRIAMGGALVNSELLDGNFVLGFWLKAEPTTTNLSVISCYNQSNPPKGFRSDMNSDGTLTFLIENNNSYLISGTTAVDDNEWHFVVFKVFDNEDYEIWVDDVLDASGNYNGNWPNDMTNVVFSGNNIGTRNVKLRFSHFFIGTTANVTNTILTNIYDYGQDSIQATAFINGAVVKFDSSYNDEVNSLGPTLDFRLDEGSGATVVRDALNAVPANLQGTLRTSGIAGKNNRAINFTDIDTRYVGSYQAPTGTFSVNNQQTISVLFKSNGVTGDFDRICGTGMENLNGMSVEVGANGNMFLYSWTDEHYFEIVSDGTYDDGQWHHFVGVKDGNTGYIYVDGKLDGTGDFTYTLSDTLRVAVGGVGVAAYGNYDYSAARDTTIDEFAIYPIALTQQQAFELYQAVSLSMDTTASASLPMPTTELGTGNIILADPMLASAEQLDPSISAPFLGAFAEFLMPNFGTTVVVDANYGHMAFEADALFHDPQFSIGEINSVDHMDASALMVDPIIITPGTVTAPVLIAGDAELVEPGIVVIKGAQVFADPALANSFLPLPPAYVTLFDDQWFVTLLEGHADRAIEPVQAIVGNLPGQTSTDVIRGGFLSFFNEFNLDITLTTQINSISSEIPAHYFDREDTIRYDNNGNIIPLDISKNVSPARAPRGTGLTTPRMGVGYFDDYERKAVRVENIEFPLPGTSAQFSERPYNLEFSIKTTKKDQVLAYGYNTSITGTRRNMGVIGLSDGKIYLTEDSTQRYSSGLRNLFSLSAPHPKNFVNRAQYLLSKTDIADGQWHHIIVQQGYEDGRTQIWIDGKLDRQLGATDADGRIFLSSTPGLDGTNKVRPYILGFNSNDPLLYSDFETSGWNFYPGRFLTSQQTLVNYLAYAKYDPIKVEPMIGTVIIGQDNIAQGNRARMLLLYWWRNPVGRNQFIRTVSNPLTTGYDGNNSPWTPEDLIDDPKKGPIFWEGWDVFPVGVINPGISDMVKLNNVGPSGYIDIENGRVRLLNLQEDLDLSQFDTIMFANYPSTSEQLDEFIRNEVVDTYFGVKESDLYDEFLKSLRLAVDNGMSLLVQFDQLARDLKIYDRVERIPIFNEGLSDERAFWHTNNVSWDLANNRPNAYESDIPGNPGFNVFDEGKSNKQIDIANGAYFNDWYDNMRHRVINTVELLTDDPTYIITDRARYQNSDFLDFGAPDRVYERFEYRIQGLQPGDEFVFGNPSSTTTFGNTRARQNSILAIPFENVKAGRIITAQPEKYWKGAEYVDNPYKNYAHSIALLPGDVLDGRGIGGKIFVCISEVFWDKTNEYRFVDLYTDYWIDISYDLGFFGPVGSQEALDRRAELKNVAENPGYWNSTGKTAEHNAWGTYWSRNDNFAFSQVSRRDQDFSGVLGLLFESSIELDRVPTSRKALTAFSRRRDQLGRFASGAGGSGQLFFQIKAGRTTEIMNVFVPNLFTRAFWWLSDRLRPTGLVQRPQSASASAFMPEAVAVVDKEIIRNVTPMIANANIGQNIGGTVEITDKSVTINTLPLTANAIFVELGKNIFADAMTATTLLPDPGIFTFSLEEIILTIANIEAVVYVRGDKIT